MQKTLATIDIRVEEILASLGALGRRLDQLQKSVLDLLVTTEKNTTDSDLADTVKGLEDRLRRLEGNPKRTA